MPKKAPQPVPAGMNTVTPHLWFNGNCKDAVEFYQKAFGVILPNPIVFAPDGHKVMHAMIKFGDTNIMMADAWPGLWEKGPENGTSVGLWVYVVDCDILYNQACNMGCEIIDTIMDAFWGDRVGKIKDPFGHCWAIASHKWILTPEEMSQRQKEWQESLNQ